MTTTTTAASAAVVATATAEDAVGSSIATVAVLVVAAAAAKGWCTTFHTSLRETTDFWWPWPQAWEKGPPFAGQPARVTLATTRAESEYRPRRRNETRETRV
jgi:hypothetical protein